MTQVSAFTIMVLLCLTVYCQAQNTDPKDLAVAYISGVLDKTTFEREVDKLTNDESNLQKNETLYFVLASILADHGPAYFEEAAKYAKIVVQSSTDPLQKCKSFLIIGNALEYKIHLEGADAIVIHRKEIVQTYLQIANLISKQLSVAKTIKLPRVNSYDLEGPSDDPIFQKKAQQLAAEHEKEIQIRSDAKLQNQFLYLKTVVYSNCIRLYSIKPYNNDEFEQECRMVVSNPDYVNDLIMQLKFRQNIK